MKGNFYLRALFFLLILPCTSVALPKTILWVWNARQNLQSMPINNIGLAIYAGTITLNQTGLHLQANQQLMTWPNTVYRLAIVHLTLNRVATFAEMKIDLTDLIAKRIIQLWQNSGINDLQIDCSALQSQQDFYANIIRDVRQKLPKTSSLSITALANWCVGDRWLENLPIDYAVPMLFSLGTTDLSKRRFIEQFPTKLSQLAPSCQQALGLATFADWQPSFKANIPVFVFTRGRWTANKITQALQLSNRYQ